MLFFNHDNQEEKKVVERELARTKVNANRVAVVVANDWKDANDKVMPVKQWLEERRFLQVGCLYIKPFILYTPSLVIVEGEMLILRSYIENHAMKNVSPG
jgi:hypothetical protein